MRQFTRLLQEMTRVCAIRTLIQMVVFTGTFAYFQKPMWLRSAIVNAIETRRKLLHKLREQNLDSFEKLLKELRIAYRVPPLVEDVPLQTRKGWVEHQVSLLVCQL